MNPDTGKIITGKEWDFLKEENPLESNNYIEVDESEMTEKQKITKKVSLHDNRSMLGKRAASYRAKKRKNNNG